MQTRVLADFIARARLEDIPEVVQDDAVRALVDWLGCALGGAMDEAVETSLDALCAWSSPQQATLIGRGNRTDILSAALHTAIGSSVLDFDATHVPTSIQPSAPIASALFALAEQHAAPGTEVLHAFILGVEVACRAGLALGNTHYERGWHNTGTCGVLGAAAACAKLLGLDAKSLAAALGIAATQAGGINALMGSPSHSLNVGFAARNGLCAALLAQQGFSAADGALEGRRGFLSVLGPAENADSMLTGLGSTWEITRTPCMPFPCNALLHPVIDACLQLRRDQQLRARNISAVDLRVHPQVTHLGATRQPQSTIESKRSVYHCTAVALLDGCVGLRQFQSERVLHPHVTALRDRIETLAESRLGADEAHVAITLSDGRSVERHVRRSFGQPMTDVDASDKFRALAADALATDQAERLLALAWNIRALGDVGALVRASVPDEVVESAELPGSPLIPR